MIAEIAVSAAPFAIDKPYSYYAPAHMHLQPGMRVIVPFGRGNKKTEGVVIRLSEGQDASLKTVLESLDDTPLLAPWMLRLAAFMRQRYFCSFYDCVRTMLPAGLWFRERNLYALTEDRSWKEAPCRREEAMALLRLLEELGGEAKESALLEHAGSQETLQEVMAYLIRKKWVRSETQHLRKLSDKTEKIATLRASAEEAMEYAASRPRSAAMQRSVLEVMCSVGCVSVKELCYYTGASAATVKRLEDLGYLELTEKPVLRCREIKPARIQGPLTLNPQQQEVLDGLWTQMQSQTPGVGLLHGVTGSGKTAVYIKLIQKTLENGKSALLLVPEIALTPQLLSQMAAYFGESVAVQHSSLSAAERYDQWKRIRSGEAKVIVGTRSAVFAPAPQLGLIIVDEEQEHSYKSENAPRYDAREIALWRGAKESVLVLFGSATPSVETMYRAKIGQYQLYRLPDRYNGRPLPDVQIIDMRKELEAGNDLSLSRYLMQAMEDTAANGKQSILFLNRRGNSRSLVCVDCRKVPECPRCSTALVYHSANHRLMCHYCGYSQNVPERCGTCGGPLKPIGTGTQKVQQELQQVFPQQEIIRMDTDTVNAVNTHEKLLERFEKENIPVLIGTQMVAKGLNLPDVTLVGVLDADLSLYSDSYRASETTFNMLTQVVGRAGRGNAMGQAVIQTMAPEHPVIRLAAVQDYDGFYETEIGLRRIQNCPPFGDLATITFLGQEEARVLHGAEIFRESLEHCLKQPQYAGEVCQVLGPAPCVIPKINYNFRYRLTLRCKMTGALRTLLAHFLRQFMQDKGNRGVSAFVDVNGAEE